MSKLAMQRTEVIKTLSQLRSRYRGVLLDQFGVLHDGKRAYPEAVAAVQRLADDGVSVYILSNSSRRSEVALQKIEALGFPRACFSGAMTSGEVTHRMLEDRPGEPWATLGRKCLHITWGSRGAIDIASLGLEVVTDPENAEFILTHGTQALGQPDGGVEPRSLDELRAVLRRCGELGGRPMVVANPDFVTVSGKELVPMPGALGRFYRDECGGRTLIMGKPDPVIYDLALAELALEKGDILAIGDSMEHDVAGAHAAGVDALFVAGGIHESELLAASEGGGAEGVDAEAVARIAGAAGLEALPAFTIGALRW